MRILLVNYEYPPVGGGAATATQEIAKALVRLGHDALVLTGSYQGLPRCSEEDGIAVNRLPVLRKRIDRSNLIEMATFLIAGLISVRGLIKRHHIQSSIIFFTLPCGPIGLFSRYAMSIPYVVSLRGGDVPGTESSLNLLHKILKPVRRLILKRSCAIVANSDGLKKIAEAADPFPIRVIPNGVDTDFFVPADSHRHRERAGGFQVLFVGRFQKQKNLTFLFQEVARLQPDSMQLHLVGDGPEKGLLQRLAKKLGIGTAIAWHGWLSRQAVRRMYQTADCLVNPSLYEGMPNVVLEAMASGLPIVASNVPGSAQLVVNGETGFLFDLGRPDALAEKIRRLETDPLLRNQLGANARSRVREMFSWQRVAQDYVAILSGRPAFTGR